MNALQIKQVENMIKNLIFRTIQEGATIEQAISHSYSKMNADYPEILAYFLAAKTNN